MWQREPLVVTSRGPSRESWHLPRHQVLLSPQAQSRWQLPSCTTTWLYCKSGSCPLPKHQGNPEKLWLLLATASEVALRPGVSGWNPWVSLFRLPLGWAFLLSPPLFLQLYRETQTSRGHSPSSQCLMTQTDIFNHHWNPHSGHEPLK